MHFPIVSRINFYHKEVSYHVSPPVTTKIRSRSQHLVTTLWLNFIKNSEMWRQRPIHGYAFLSVIRHTTSKQAGSQYSLILLSWVKRETLSSFNHKKNSMKTKQNSHNFVHPFPSTCTNILQLNEVLNKNIYLLWIGPLNFGSNFLGSPAFKIKYYKICHSKQN